jgi:hypothetical protein
MQNSKLLALALGIYVTTPPSICVGVGPPLDIVMLAWLVGISIVGICRICLFELQSTQSSCAYLNL